MKKGRQVAQVVEQVPHIQRLCPLPCFLSALKLSCAKKGSYTHIMFSGAGLMQKYK